MMKAAGFAYVRTSAMQYENASASMGSFLNNIIRAGMDLVIVVSSGKGFMSIPLEKWKRYVANVVKWAPAQTLWQILNEPNTQLFAGGQPDAAMALVYFNAARDIIRAKYPNAYIIAPGLTNESKNGVGKISARTFLETWEEAGAKPSAYGLNYYHDRPSKTQDLRLFKSNIAWLKARGRTVIITETGARSPGNAATWYAKLRKGELGDLRHGFWYCMDHHLGFQLCDNALKPSALYNLMVKDAKA